MKKNKIFIACDSNNISKVKKIISKTQKSRISRNPKTGEKVNTPEKKTIHFKMGKELFKKINNEEE